MYNISYYLLTMKELTNIFSNLETFHIIIIAIFLIWAILFFFIIKAQKKAKNKALKFKADNPTAAKVIFTTKSGLTTTSYFTLNSVNKNKPENTFYEGVNAAIYLLPGDYEINFNVVAERPGILSRKVRTNFGPIDTTITVKADRTYKFCFNVKEENYYFEEFDETNKG